MKTYLKIFILISLFLFFLVAPKYTFAESYYFQDEFNSSLPFNTMDSTKWQVSPNNLSYYPTIRQTGGNVLFTQANNTTTFPYAVSQNAFPNGDFIAEIKFQYMYVSYWGTGITFAEQNPDDTSITNPLSISVWQDKSIGPNMRIQYNGTSVYTIPTNTNSHLFKIERKDNKYLIYLDNQLIYTSEQTDHQIKYIVMGNTVAQTSLIPSWTQFNADYVHIEQTQPTKVPVVFIPGIAGSELQANSDINWAAYDGHGGTYTHFYPKGEGVWVNIDEARKFGEDDYFDVLKLFPDGETSMADIETSGSIFAYDKTIDFFASHGYTLNKDFFLFPYDWRKDITDTTPLLDQKIQQIEQQTGSNQVDIVAHSMGGLVARNYINDDTRAQNVRKLVTLGTPYLGSVKLLKTLMYGDCLTKSPYTIVADIVCLGVAPQEVKDVMQNMTGSYELAPSPEYYLFYYGTKPQYPTPIDETKDLDQNGISGELTYSQAETLLKNLRYNTPLLDKAADFHTIDTSLSDTHGVDTSIIVGSGIPTWGQLDIGYYTDLLGTKRDYYDAKMINGDETVPLYSASLNDPTRSLSLSGNAKVYYANDSHGDLVNDENPLTLVLNILNDNPQIPPSISSTPFKLKGTLFSIHSPVNIDVYDQNGNHTGPKPDGNFEENIPHSHYETLGDAKFVWVPDGVYTIHFTATDNGQFDFRIRNYTDDINNKTILYKDIPLQSDTSGEATVDTTSNNYPIISLDENGDGTFDTSISKSSILIGDAANDTTAPKTTIQTSGVIGTNNWYKSDVAVSLDAQDEASGSGVLQTLYSLDNGKTTQIYEGAFTITTEGQTEITYQSIDKNGNVELPHTTTIKIDKTTPEVTVKYSPDIQSFDLEGVDNLSTVTRSQFDNDYYFTDEAGNQITLVTTTSNNGNTHKLNLINISYNDQETTLPDNTLQVIDTRNAKDSIVNLEQHYLIGDTQYHAIYQDNHDTTTIQTISTAQTNNQSSENGLILLQLFTNQGNLDIKY